MPSYLWMKATAAANMRCRPETNTSIGTGHAKAVLSFYAAKVITTYGFLNWFRHRYIHGLSIRAICASPGIFEDDVCRTKKKERYTKAIRHIKCSLVYLRWGERASSTIASSIVDAGWMQRSDIFVSSVSPQVDEACLRGHTWNTVTVTPLFLCVWNEM